MTGWQAHTMQKAYQEICEGELPWIALGNFLNYWFCYAIERRVELVADSLSATPAGEYEQRWAAYCAASVEHLCKKYSIPCPVWVHHPEYVLPEPWYDIPRPELLAQVRDGVIKTTPIEFSKRNIYCGDGMFANKWELSERRQEAIERWKREQWPRIVRARKIIRERLRQRRKALAAK